MRGWRFIFLPTSTAPAELPPDISSYEPRLALDGGADGLDLIRRLLDMAPTRLRPGGAQPAQSVAGGPAWFLTVTSTMGVDGRPQNRTGRITAI